MKGLIASDRFERMYALALRLYPGRFQEAYAGAMRQSFRDALEDRAVARRELIPLVLRDLITSLFKENFAMLYETFGRPAIVYNALVLIGLSTGLALALNTIPQQVLRQGANDPQIAMAGDLAARLESGVAPAAAVPATDGVDMARSLSPFVIVYDEQGKPVASQGVLNGQTPAPPQGVFDYVRQHGEERVSWQPVLGTTSNNNEKTVLNGGGTPQRGHGVRIAAVIQRVGGAGGGFVLAGRNMREVEAREAQVGQLALLTWIGMMGVILVGTGAYGWWTRAKAA
jgi:hypothetical protein